jgi:AcrR family transcriptional regulator
MEASLAPTGRALRADARRNRESILTAARAAFAEAGVQAPMEDVARRAGVGVGTVYRHFPTKEALIGELLAQKFRLLLEGARDALDVEDPWEAFAGTLRRNAELMAADAAVQDALMRADADAAWSYAEEAREELKSTFAIVIERAKAAGAIRADFTIEDVPLLMCGLSSTMAAGAAGGTFDWRRHLELILDGIRARPPG